MFQEGQSFATKFYDLAVLGICLDLQLKNAGGKLTIQCSAELDDLPPIPILASYLHKTNLEPTYLKMLRKCQEESTVELT